MNKTQWFLLAIGLVLTVVLYQLPKIIINKDKKAVVAAESSDKQSSSAQEIPHASINAEDLQIINRLRKSFYTFSNQEKKIIFADSLAKVFERLSKFDSALKYREEIVGIEPLFENRKVLAAAYFNAANFTSDQTKGSTFNRRAQELYQELLQEKPELLEIKTKLAMTFVSTETPMQGIMLLREVLEKNPNFEPAIFNLGLLAIQSGQFDKAKLRFDRLLELDPKNWNAHFYLGIIAKETGKTDEAINHFKMVEANDPDPMMQANVKGYLKEIKP
jgi:tetratricopeptide (TPR) repeat protein